MKEQERFPLPAVVLNSDVHVERHRRYGKQLNRSIGAFRLPKTMFTDAVDKEPLSETGIRSVKTYPRKVAGDQASVLLRI